MQKHYEDAILNHPAIYNKIVSTYKNIQRKINSKEKTQDYAKKRLSSNKITGLDKLENFTVLKEKPVRLAHKTSDSDGKNDQ